MAYAIGILIFLMGVVVGLIVASPARRGHVNVQIEHSTDRMLRVLDALNSAARAMPGVCKRCGAVRDEAYSPYCAACRRLQQRLEAGRERQGD